jgi:hypothetical protein
MSTSKPVVYWTATVLIAFVFVASGLFKLFPGEKAAEMAQGFGSAQNVLALGILELIIATVWVIRRTGIIGTLLAVAYMGGAIAVHLVTHQPLLIPVVVETLVVGAAFVRFPELTHRIQERE